MNATDEQRDRLGLHPEQLAKLNPSLILVQLDAFGGPATGFKSNHLGYDDLAQAATGVMTRFGGGMETPEEHAHFGTIDVLTGYCACVSLGAALLQRKETGLGSVARSSLAAAGNLIQAQFMYDFDRREEFDEPSGRQVKGWGPFYHCYRASDQWLFLAAPDEQNDLLRRCTEFGALQGMPEDRLVCAIGQIIMEHPLSFWQSKLNQGSTTVVPLASLQETRDAALQYESDGKIDVRLKTFRAIRHDRHPMGRWVDLVAPNAVRSQKAPIAIPGPMPKYGQHSEPIMQDWGYDEPSIKSLIESGIVGKEWSNRYLPE